MSSVIEVTALGLVTFAATNIDDLFVLVAFFSDPAYKARQVVVGQYAGIAILTAASMACSLAALAVPHAYVGLLGLVPIAVGAKRLLAVRVQEEGAGRPRPGGGPAILSVAAVTMANGGDNLAVYIPVFSSRGSSEWAVLACVFAILTGIWCLLGYSLVNHPAIGRPLRRYGRHMLPWVLMGLGAWILIP